MRRANTAILSYLFSSLLLTGCASKVSEPEQYSGFLQDYDVLRETTSTSEAPVLRWIVPGFRPSTYSTVVFDGLILYPAAKPTQRVDLNTLHELQAYTTTSAKQALSRQYMVVSDLNAVPPGSQALILRAAITGVSASNEGMNWYEVIPVAAVIGVTQAVSGHRDQNTELYIEAELVDATTQRSVAKAVRKIVGHPLEHARQRITTQDFQAAIDATTNDMQMMLLR